MTTDYELKLQQIYERLLRPGDWVVDIGAHTGRHTIPAAEKVRPGGRVLAFEPLPSLTLSLMDNIRRAEVHDAVTFHQVALSEEAGQTEFNHAIDAPWLSGLQARTYTAETRIEKLPVRVERLDNLLSGAPGLRYIKIDAEGGELFALRGASESIAKFRPVVSFEFGESAIWGYGITVADMADFWLARDYLIFDVLARPLDRDAFIQSARDQHVWDYVVIPREQAELADVIFGRKAESSERGDPVPLPKTEPVRRAMNLGFEMLLDKDCPEQAAAIATGEYDPTTLRRARALLPPGGVALDIGANVGVYACGLGAIARRSGGRVFAFEPVPNNAARLRENVALNQLQPVVELGEFAFGREPGELVLHMPPEGWVNNAVGQNMMAPWDLDHVRKHGWREFRAEVRRMDDWARTAALDRCDLIKIDVEGAEMLVFEGGRGLIERFRPVIIGEFSPYWMNQIGQSFQDVLAFFEPMGYRFFREFEWDLRPLTPDLIATGTEVPNYYLFPSDKPQALETALSVSR